MEEFEEVGDGRGQGRRSLQQVRPSLVSPQRRY
jgi:hypothetical protein